MPPTPDPRQAAADKAAADEAAKQAALDKEAAHLQAKADAEAKRLADLEADAQKAAEQAEDHGQDRVPRCPQCNQRMEKYEGSNPHKESTAFCPEHGRMPIYRNKVVES